MGGRGGDDPHIIPAFEAGESDGGSLIAMRYVPAVTRVFSAPAELLAPRRAAAIVSSVASALDAAHGAGLGAP